MKVFGSILGISLLGCTPNFQERDWATLPVTERQKMLSEITRKCRLPDNRATILKGNQVQVQPSPNDSYEAVDCLLGGLKSLRGIELGFVGNEALSNEAH